MHAEAHIEDHPAPERTCVGCRHRDAKSALLRFAIQDAAPRLVPDVRSRLPGRGVSVHPRRECVERALKRGGFAKAIGGAVGLDLDAVCALAASQYERRAFGLIGAAHRAKAAAVGTDSVRDALTSGGVPLLIVADDAAGRREELTAVTERLGGRALVFTDKVTLGRLVGRAEVAVLAVLDSRIAEEVATAVARAQALSAASVGVSTPAGRKA